MRRRRASSPGAPLSGALQQRPHPRGGYRAEICCRLRCCWIVTAFHPGRSTGDPQSKAMTIEVSRAESSLRASRQDGTLVFFAPVTTGSQHDPLPPGQWKVKSVNWRPLFHYNPDLFWDAKPGDAKTTIQPGPNSPVGVVWIGLDLEHYGLHGTPEPGQIGRTASHGCVRLTNWDAARLAALVRPGTPVLFR
jgi:lipoprotein-anchoring transpeptidase ErfK/SrfK